MHTQSKAVTFTTPNTLPNDIIPVEKRYRPVLEIIRCKYRFRDYEFVFTVDLLAENPSFVAQITLAYFVDVNLCENSTVNIDFFAGTADKKQEFLSKAADAFELCDLAPAILEDVKKAYFYAKNEIQRKANDGQNTSAN